MWSDMAVALEDLAAVRFLLIPASATSSTTNNPSPNSTKQATSIPKEYLPQIHGCRDALQVSNRGIRSAHQGTNIDDLFCGFSGYDPSSPHSIFRSAV